VNEDVEKEEEASIRPRLFTDCRLAAGRKGPSQSSAETERGRPARFREDGSALA